MEIKEENIKCEKFDYQDSAVKERSFTIRNSERKRLFCEYTEVSSDEETEHVEKKVKITKQQINFQTEILKSFQGKEYESCLNQIDEYFKLTSKDLQTRIEAQSQVQLIQIACWTMMDVNQKEAFKSLKEILEKEPTNSFAFYALGLAQYRSGDLAASMTSFGKAIDLNPTAAMKRGLEYKAKAKNFLDIMFDGEFSTCFLLNWILLVGFF